MQANRKRHSTTKEALTLAQESQAYRTILTHFSQRYPKLPPGLADLPTESCCVAFDGMRVPLVALPDLPMLLPVLQVTFGDQPVPCDCSSESAGRPASLTLIMSSHATCIQVQQTYMCG